MSNKINRYMEAMARNFQSGAAQGITLTYQLQLNGDGPWTVQVQQGQCQVRPGAPPTPTVTIIMGVPQYFQLAEGQLNLGQAFQQQQILVDGPPQYALKFVEMFPPWASLVQEAQTQPPPPAQPTEPTPPPAVAAEGAAPHATLRNGSFDEYQPFVYNRERKVWKEDRFPEEYGKYWQLDVLNVGGSRFHMMRSGVFGKFAQRYFGGNGSNYKFDPFDDRNKHSQVITSRYSFDLLLRQTVAAQPGRKYRFSGKSVTFFKGPEPPPVHNKLFVRVGIDPLGGTSAHAPSVVWGERLGRDNQWNAPEVSTTAQTDTITVFIRVENTEEEVGSADLNTVHLDNFKLE